MLAKFRVENFKSFNTPFEFDLEKTNKYEFNEISIKNDIVNHSLIYGHNGVGKSNLGLAIFDIVHHLTDYMVNEELFSNYINANNPSLEAKFYYKFKFGQDIVEYRYSKSYSKIPIKEELLINDKEVASIDKSQGSKAIINIAGAESLNRNITNKDLSLLKYIRSNTQLDTNKENDIINSFLEYVDGMLFFRSVNQNMFIGFTSKTYSIQTDLIERNKVSDLEEFLNNSGITCKLSYDDEPENKIIFFVFKERKIPIYEIASTGTKSLILFFSWLQNIKSSNKAKFLFIDEFDAFYHHTLSTSIIEELKNSGIQFMLTTHNTTNITNNLLRPDCYFLMHTDRINSLSNLTTKELREAHNIEKMYKAGAFNEL